MHQVLLLQNSEAASGASRMAIQGNGCYLLSLYRRLLIVEGLNLEAILT